MLISIVIPFFNRRDLLLEALDSVARQSYSSWEAILVDDGSTDGGAEAASKWLQNHPGELITLDHGGFPGRARNAGADHARGQWLAFLDSDDLWESEKLAHQVQAIEERPEIQIWHCREKWLRSGRIISQRKQRHKREGDIFQDALKKCIIGPSTVLIHRDLWKRFKGFREDMEVAEDYELWLRYCAGNEVGFLEEPLTIKRAGDWDQLSEKYGQIEIFRIDGLKELVDQGWFAENGRWKTQALARAELAEKCRIYSLGCEKRGKIQEARKYRDLALSYSP